MTETPADAESVEAKKTADELHLKLVRAEETQASGDGGGTGGNASSESGGGPSGGERQLDQQTLEGIRRLSKLIREKKKENPKPKESTDASSPRGISEREKKRALQVYRRVAEAKDPRSNLGAKINNYL